MKEQLLAIDRGSKKIGLARRSSETKIVMPIGYIVNDETCVSSLSALIQRYTITKIIVGETTSHKKEKASLIELLSLSHPEITIETSDESYTTVQAKILLKSQEIQGASDTIAAMYILEHYLSEQKKNYLAITT